MPTLGEFVAHARKYGFRQRRVVLEQGPRGRDSIVYLWRAMRSRRCVADLESRARTSAWRFEGEGMDEATETVTLSSKYRLVLPKGARERLTLRPGDADHCAR